MVRFMRAICARAPPGTKPKFGEFEELSADWNRFLTSRPFKVIRSLEIGLKPGLTKSCSARKFWVMLTITEQQATEQFGKFAKMASDGQRILVTLEGQPLVILQPPPKAKGEHGASHWPDYPAHWQTNFPDGPGLGSTATELLAQDKEDRF